MGNDTITTGRVGGVTVTLHKLTAGDGYTYLTRQVAAADSTERGYTSLGDYYAAKGESPGRWWGRGLESLGTGGAVTEQQMLNLFGQGIHPDAERIQARSRTPGAVSVPQAVRRGPAGPGVPGYEGTAEWRERLARAVRGLEPGPRASGRLARIPAEDRTRIRTERGPGDVHRTARPGPATPSRSCPGSSAQQSRPDAVGGRRVRPDVLPGEVGVHPVGGRPPGDLRADRGRARRRGHQDAGVPASGGRVHPGRRPAVAQVDTRGLVDGPVHPPGLPGR